MSEVDIFTGKLSNTLLFTLKKLNTCVLCYHPQCVEQALSLILQQWHEVPSIVTLYHSSVLRVNFLNANVQHIFVHDETAFDLGRIDSASYRSIPSHHVLIMFHGRNVRCGKHFLRFGIQFSQMLRSPTHKTLYRMLCIERNVSVC